MPISPRTSNTGMPERPVAPPAQSVPVQQPMHQCHPWKHGDEFGHKILMTLFGVLLVYATFYIGSLMRNSVRQYDFIGKADQNERMITINGFAKVTAKNDIAMTTIGYFNIDADIAKAQADNKKVMDAVINDLKQLGIEEKDMRTDYTMNPEYDYTQKGQVFKGYRVTNNVTVKIRDLTKINQVLGLPAKDGANQVGGLSFTIDDTENLKTLARTKAMADAKRRAAQLANSLGVVLGEVVSYNDYESTDPGMYYGRGGGMAMDAAAPAVVASGSNDVNMNVSITYKIYSGNY